MEALFAPELGRARRAGLARSAMVALAGIGDVLRRGVYERWRAERGGEAAGAGGARGQRDGRGARSDTVRESVAHVLRSLWRARFGGAPDVIGRTLPLDEEPHTVIGVLPEAFAFPESEAGVYVIVPLRLRADPADEGQNYTIVARLTEDVDPDAAQADVERLFAPFPVMTR